VSDVKPVRAGRITDVLAALSDIRRDEPRGPGDVIGIEHDTPYLMRVQPAPFSQN
jgi:hypothetical protein